MKKTLIRIVALIVLICITLTLFSTYAPAAIGTGKADNQTVCKGTGLCPSSSFTDAPLPGSWSHSAVDYACKRGYFSGTSEKTISPDASATRGMFVCVLSKLDGADLEDYRYSGCFSDVKEDDYFARAVEWAFKNGIAKGTGEATFSPNSPVSREQAMAFLYSYAEYKGYNTEISSELVSFADAASVSQWAQTCVKWCVFEGLISGVRVGGSVFLSPRSPMTRSQLAVIVMAFDTRISFCLGNVLVLGDSYSSFETSVPEGYKAYYDENDDTVYSPDRMWWGLLINETNSSLLFNDSYSGTTICNTGYNKTYCPDISFIGRLQKFIKESDASRVDTVIIFGGTHDSWADSPIGSEQYDNFSEDDLRAFMPAFCYMIKLIQEEMPYAKIINICNCDIKGTIISGMQNVCEKMNVTCVTLSQIKKDLRHPTYDGMVQIKDAIISELKKQSF